MMPVATTSSSRGRLSKEKEETMPLSRQKLRKEIESHCKRWEEEKVQGILPALAAWAVIADEILMMLERRGAIVPEPLPIRDSARFLNFHEAVKNLLDMYQP
jgi:hypothetical protein